MITENPTDFLKVRVNKKQDLAQKIIRFQLPLAQINYNKQIFN